MPRRVIDFEAMWASDKLAACAEWAQAEYAWLYGLADANGSFELTNLRVIWGRVAAIRKNLSLERLEQIFDEFRGNGLLFSWEDNGKRYGHWTKSELPGRLPPPSWRNRLERLAPPVPREALDEYLRRFGGRETRSPLVTTAPPEPPGRELRDSGRAALAELKASVETAQAQDQDKEGNREEDLSSLTGASQPAEHLPAPTEPIRSEHEFGRGIAPQILLEVYEQERGGLPAVKALTAQRLSKCKARLSQRNFLLEDFRAAVRKASQTPFLCGASARGWRASFDWFVANDTNYLKVLEGRYDPPGDFACSQATTWHGPARAGPGSYAHTEARAGLGPTLAGARIKPSILEKLRQREEAQKVHARWERGSPDVSEQDAGPGSAGPVRFGRGRL